MANKKAEPRLAPIMHQYLNDLVKTGAYGATPSDVARTLIEIGVRDALAKKVIKVRRARRSTP